MENEKIGLFQEKLKSDQNLQELLKSRIADYQGDSNDVDAFLEAVIMPIAKEAGYSFTVEEMKQVLEGQIDGQPLSDDELDAVSGGFDIAKGLGNLVIRVIDFFFPPMTCK